MLGSKVATTLAGTTSVRHSSGKLKELAIRIKSVNNIKKITKTMNMISAAKYAKAAKELPAIRGFREAGAGAVVALNEGAPAQPGTHLIFVCSSDRGLCGALHTNMCRAAKTIREEKGEDGKYVVIGEKARVSLRSMGELPYVVATVADVGRTNPTFADCAAIAQVALESEWNSGEILYNFHKSAMTQEIEGVPVASVAGLEASPSITKYDSVDEDVLQNFSEFALAASLYGCLKENYASEQAARMISMDGATKNAGEMIDRMTLRFNRLRQAVITTELCEIIAGMSAL
jgi:F-type H+-transporting ATPase subunit gamma